MGKQEAGGSLCWQPFRCARHLLGQEGIKDLECSTWSIQYLDLDVD